MRKSFKITALTIAMFAVISITAFANAGPSEWYGSDSATVVSTADCPLIVQSEKLDFEINSLPLDYYYDYEKEKFSNYTDRFTAEYTFYNPTDRAITAQLAFPLGMMPEYAAFEIDKDKFPVLVNGQETEKEIRYTKSDDYMAFDFGDEIPKLVDGYIEDEFFKPDMTVTKYTLIPHMDQNIDYKNEIRIVWDGANTDKTRIIPYRFSGYKWEEGKKSIIDASLTGDYPVIYALGQPFDEFPQYGFYENWEDNAQEISGQLEIVTEQTTLEQVLMEFCKKFDGNWNVSWHDTFNMFVSSVNRDRDYYNTVGVIHIEELYSYKSYLVCWYLYDITVGPGETVTNTVNGPLYPDVDLEYEPWKYRYKYLLSPAQEWADFGDIEININTPYHMLEVNQKNFLITDTGYMYKGDGLPQGELEFVLCESDSPKSVNKGYMLAIGIPALLGIVFMTGTVVAMVHIFRKYD